VEFEVVWTDRALISLQEVHSFLAQFNPAAAGRVSSAIVERVELLKPVPKMGAYYPRGSPGPYRVVVVEKYRVFYRVIEENRRVEILLIWHGSRQEPDLPL
jgi:plasmid stabilization system protein ParE